MRVSVYVDDKELKKKLNQLAKNSNRLQSTMRDIGIYMKSKVMDNFEAEGNPRWKPLSKKYLERKLQVKGTSSILEFHGKLKQSISTQTTGQYAKVFTGVKYGVYHQTGTRKMPARPFMPSKEIPDMQPFDNLGMDYISRKLKEAVMQGV